MRCARRIHAPIFSEHTHSLAPLEGGAPALNEVEWLSPPFRLFFRRPCPVPSPIKPDPDREFVEVFNIHITSMDLKQAHRRFHPRENGVLARHPWLRVTHYRVEHMQAVAEKGDVFGSGGTREKVVRDVLYERDGRGEIKEVNLSCMIKSGRLSMKVIGWTIFLGRYSPANFNTSE